MSKHVRFNFALAMLVFLAGSLTGCVATDILGPPKEAWVRLTQDSPERLRMQHPTKVDEIVTLGPNDVLDFMWPTSQNCTITLNYPDGRKYRTIKFSPDAELRDADAGHGVKVDTAVWATGKVIR